MNRSIDLQKGTKSAVCGPSQKLPSTPLEIVMMIGTMSRLFRICAACLALACATWPAYASGTTAKSQPARPEPPQDTGFLNRRIVLQGITYRFQVYLPEDWRRDDGKKMADHPLPARPGRARL